MTRLKTDHKERSERKAVTNSTISRFVSALNSLVPDFLCVQLTGILKELGYTEEMVYKF